MIDFGDTRERAGFHLLVRTAILKAAYVAATRIGAYVPRRFKIELRGSELDGMYDDIADVTDAIYRPDGLVARTIDVAVGNVRGEFADVRLIVVDSGPCTFEESLNQPKGYGPFRVVHWDLTAARDASPEAL